MGADAEEPESKAGEAKSPKTKAEDNPWYLLATLYGEPVILRSEPVLLYQDAELREKNQRAWNRYFALNLDDKTRARIFQSKGYPEEDLAPFSREELLAVREAFAKRKGSARALTLPDSDHFIDFANVQFDQFFDFDGYILTSCSFKGAIFSGEAYFRGTIFSGRWVDFRGATFAAVSTFYSATFDVEATFRNAVFSGPAFFGSATFSESANFAEAVFHSKAIFGQILADECFTFCADSPRLPYSAMGSASGERPLQTKLPSGTRPSPEWY